MRKNKLMLMLLLAILLVGCGQQDDSNTATHDLIIVGIGHANEKLFSDEIYAPEIRQVAESGGRLTVIDTSGTPTVQFSVNIPAVDKSLPTKRQEIVINNYICQISEQIEKLEVESAEVDILEALRLASRAAEDSNSSTKTIIVVDSGLSTAGDMNFSSGGYLNYNLEVSATDILSPEMIPKLPDNTNLLWYGLGDTAGKQDALSERARLKLKEIWSEILDYSTAKYVFKSTLPVENESIIAPSVTNVVVVEEAEKSTCLEAKVLDESLIHFKADTDVILNPQQTQLVLEDIANQILDNSNNTTDIVVVGATATGNESFCEELSLQRAQVIADILEEMLADYTVTIHIYGVGCSNTNIHVHDTDSNGQLIESEAKKNRIVIIGDARDDTIQKIITGYEERKNIDD